MARRSYTIGFLSQAWSLYCIPQFTGIARYVAEHAGLTLRDLRYMDNPQTPEALERGRPPWTGLVDGVITAEGVERDAKETADWMLRGGVPVINLGADLRDPRIPIIYTSAESVGELAAKHLAALGVRSFAAVGYVLSSASRMRRDAFNAALGKLGHQAASYDLKALIVGVGDDLSVLPREKGLYRLIESSPKPLGVLAINDSLGRAACRVAQELGFAVPDEVAVLGVGNSDLCWSQSPALSSICTPGEAIGFTAARTLHGMLRGKAAPSEPLRIDATELIARQSTLGKAPRDAEVQRAIDFIRRHACDGIDVEKVMQTITISRRLFEQLFAEEVGRPPGQEIQRLRFERAEQLLRETDLSIARIAQMIGFGEAASFTRFFNKRTGMSPAQWRAGGGKGRARAAKG